MADRSPSEGQERKGGGSARDYALYISQSNRVAPCPQKPAGHDRESAPPSANTLLSAANAAHFGAVRWAGQAGTPSLANAPQRATTSLDRAVVAAVCLSAGVVPN